MQDELKQVELEIARTNLQREQLALAKEQTERTSGAARWVKWSTVFSWILGGLGLAVIGTSFGGGDVLGVVGVALFGLGILALVGKSICRIILGPYADSATATKRPAVATSASPRSPSKGFLDGFKAGRDAGSKVK